MIAIDDPDDPRLAVFRQNDRGLSNRPARRDDDAPGLFIAEGDLVVERALDAGCRPVAALVDGDDVPAVAARLIDVPRLRGRRPQLRRRVVRMGRVQPIVAVFERPPRPSRGRSGRRRPTGSSRSTRSTTRPTSDRSCATRRPSGGAAWCSTTRAPTRSPAERCAWRWAPPSRCRTHARRPGRQPCGR